MSRNSAYPGYISSALILLFCLCYSNYSLAEAPFKATSKVLPNHTQGTHSKETHNKKIDPLTKIKRIVFEKPYASRPDYIVSHKLFGKAGITDDNKLFQAAKRSLNDHRDLIEFPAGQKLFNANGICFSGTWTIHSDAQEKKFTGVFAKGTQENVIVRASVALSGTTQKDKRAFGMAIKLFPKDSAHSLNAFVLNSFGGVRTKHVLDLTMNNEPSLGGLPRFGDVRTALRIKSDLEKADRHSGAEKAQYAFRPITHLANYQNKESFHSPKWLRLSPTSVERVDKNDFRDELAIQNYAQQKLVYAISVANKTEKKSQAQWQVIGNLMLTESVTSAACDQQLHFKHPKLEKRLLN